MTDNSDDLIISISTDQATLRRSIKRIETDLGVLAGSVKKQFDTVGKSIENSVTTTMQNRINGMVGVGTKAAKEWTGALADQGAELERLRAKYSPLFNTINNYKTAVSDIRRAHAIGAISANEMAAAISKERQAALASTAAIKGRNVALSQTPSRATAGGGGGSFQTANIAAQFQDIGVTAFGGMSPLQIALQQGTQLSMVFEQMKGNGQSAAAAIGGAFRSIISPISLVTIGLVAGTAALIQYFMTGDEKSEKMKQQLEEQANLIQNVAARWGEAYPALKAYADELERAKNAGELQDAQTAATSRKFKELMTSLDGLAKRAPEISKDLRDITSPEGVTAAQAYLKSMTDIRVAIEAGKDPSEALTKATEALTVLMAESGSDKVKSYAEQFSTLAERIGEAAKQSREFRMQLPDLGTLGETWAENGKFFNSDQFIPSGDLPKPQSRPLIELEGLPGEEAARKKEETAAERSKRAYEDLLKTADDRIGQMKQEIDLLGKFGIEAETARFRLDLLQNSEDKGRSLSEEQRKELEKKVALYGKYSETLAKAKLSQDLLDERRFASLSKTEQAVYQGLKEYGLPTNLDSEEAKKIRQAVNTNDLSTDIKSFFTDFSSALQQNGGDIGDAFAASIKNAAMNAMNKALDGLFSKVAEGLASLLTGGTGSGGGGAGAGGIVGAVASSAFSGGSSSSARAVSSSGGAVDLASKLIGANENTSNGQINSFLKAGGVDINAAQTKWCAAFVNSSLEQVGIKGSGSLTANSFQNWGSKIDPTQVLKGDVLLQSRGLAASAAGGHVGLATGSTRTMDGALQLQMLSGNSSDAVGTSWVNATELQVKRATEAAGALGDVAKNAASSATGLGSLASNLNAGAGSASNGLGGWFSNLFTGGTGSGLNYFPAAPGGASVFKGGSGVGLFADGGVIRGPGSGTSDSIPTMLSDEEFVVRASQSKKHRALLHAINNGTIGHMAAGGVARSIGAPVAPTLASRRSAANDNANPGVLQVQIVGASGDDHVRMLVKQGVGEGLGQYNEAQRRGGLGTLQSRYTSQRG